MDFYFWGPMKGVHKKAAFSKSQRILHINILYNNSCELVYTGTVRCAVNENRKKVSKLAKGVFINHRAMWKTKSTNGIGRDRGQRVGRGDGEDRV